MAKWYYFNDQENQCGPVTCRVLAELKDQHVISGDTRVISQDGGTVSTVDKAIRVESKSIDSCSAIFMIIIASIIMYYALTCNSKEKNLPQEVVPGQPTLQLPDETAPEKH